MGRRLKTHLNLLHPDTASRMTKKIEKNISGKVPRKFSIGDKVYAKNFYGDKWLAAEVIKVSGPLSYQVKSEEGVTLTRHVDHIRKRYPTETTTQDDWAMPDGLSSQVEATAREIPLEPPTIPPSIPPPPLVHSSPERRYPRRTRAPIDRFSPSQYS